MRLENKEVDLRCSETEALIQAKAGSIYLECQINLFKTSKSSHSKYCEQKPRFLSNWSPLRPLWLALIPDFFCLSSKVYIYICHWGFWLSKEKWWTTNVVQPGRCGSWNPVAISWCKNRSSWERCNEHWNVRRCTSRSFFLWEVILWELGEFMCFQKKRVDFLILWALSTICQGQRLHQEQRERQESFSQRIKESRSLCQKLPESKAYDPLLSWNSEEYSLQSWR